MAVNQPQNKENIKNFAQWCEQKNSLPKETKHTVEILLKQAATNNCKKAEQELNKLEELELDKNKISDLKPLSELTNLTALSPNFNEISDLKPLSGLTNLTVLSLSANKISDLKPLSGIAPRSV